MGPVSGSAGEPTTFHQINCRLHCSETSIYTKVNSLFSLRSSTLNRFHCLLKWPWNSAHRMMLFGFSSLNSLTNVIRTPFPACLFQPVSLNLCLWCRNTFRLHTILDTFTFYLCRLLVIWSLASGGHIWHSSSCFLSSTSSWFLTSSFTSWSAFDNRLGLWKPIGKECMCLVPWIKTDLFGSMALLVRFLS